MNMLFFYAESKGIIPFNLLFSPDRFALDDMRHDKLKIK